MVSSSPSSVLFDTEVSEMLLKREDQVERHMFELIDVQNPFTAAETTI